MIQLIVGYDIIMICNTFKIHETKHIKFATYFRANISFSVIPSSDVEHAKTNIKIPNEVWMGMYDARRWDARPGKRNVINPPSHWNSE